MNKYFKFPAESNLGIGVQYIEFNDSGWAVRQAECYEGKWFNSSKSYHEELTSSSLCDQKLTESGIKLGDTINYQEFETIWQLSNQSMVLPDLITKKEDGFISKTLKKYWVGTPSIWEDFWAQLSIAEDKWLVDNIPRFFIPLMKVAEISKFCLSLLIESVKLAIESITNTQRP